MSLDAFFHPRTIAVIGASNNPLKLGYEVYKNLKVYSGKIYPINVREETVQGDKAYRSLNEIADDIDLAIIVVPKKFVKESLIECGEKGVKAVIIITAGFGETGEKGKKEEEELLSIAREYGMRLIGPNCVGIMNTKNNLNATFIMKAKPGSIAFISQSGALGAGVVYKTLNERIGFSKFVSVGNMIDVDFTELIDYFSKDPQTTAIALYVEGISDGKRFMKTAEEAIRKKPVIVLKAGKSESGAKAISSHTGSLAGSYDVYKAAFRQSGVIIAETIDEMLSMARAFTTHLPMGNRVAIMTNAGGPGVLTADEADKKGLRLAVLEEKTKRQLREFLPSIASINNPVDMIASARGEDYYKTLKTLLHDKDTDIVISICVVPTFAGMTLDEHAKGIIKAIEDANAHKPVIALFMAGKVSEKARELLEEKGIPTYERPEDAAAAAQALYTYSMYVKEKRGGK